MTRSSLLRLLVAALAANTSFGGDFADEDYGLFPLLMPNIVPAKNEVYLCTMAAVDAANDTFWIRGFTPVASTKTMHHMAVAGCYERPPTTRFNMWNCGQNGKPALDPAFPEHPVCPDSTGSGAKDTTIYLWGKAGEPVVFPEGVGMQIGQGSRIRYLVLQVHYISISMLPKTGDTSGVVLHYTRTPQPLKAAMLSMHVMTRLPARTVTFQDVACAMREDKILHPFGVLMHTHRHGHLVSSWRVRRDTNSRDQWDLIGKRDPRKPQSFYPPEDPSLVLRKGDTLAFRCTMMNFGDSLVSQGLASYDEMCDLYMLYWTADHEGGHIEGDNYCYSKGIPAVTWTSLGFNNIPVEATARYK